MSYDETLKESLERNGVSRRGFLKFCATTASLDGAAANHGSSDCGGA